MTATATGMNNLTTLIKRLEAATSRLEDIATSTSGIDVTPRSTITSPSAASHSQPVVAAPVPTPSTSASSAAPPTPAEDVSASISEFDTIVKDDLDPFNKTAQDLGGLVADITADFCKAFRAQRKVLVIASHAKEPSQESPVYAELLSELQQGIAKVNGLREKNRKCAQDNHLAMVAEGVGLIAWVTIKPKPSDYIGEVLGGAQMYGNRILKEFKDKEPTQVEWVRAFVRLCGSLKSYTQENHRTGLAWNPKGKPAEQALKDADVAKGPSAPSAPPAGSAAAPPPPPPPPPPPALDLPAAGPASGQAGDMSSVFADLNKGESVTAGLRKVDKSQMTHKNPSLRANATQASSPSTSRGKSPTPNRKPDSLKTKKPSRCELDGNKWYVENYDQNDVPAGKPLEIQVEKQQSILISRCKSITIQVVGKANAISVDNCNRLDMLVDSLVSSVDVINSSSYRLQILGQLPSISLDKVDGATVFLSKESLATEVYSSKCTSINITLPPQSEYDDSVECPVPEQLRTWIENGKLVSEIVKQEG